VSVVTPLVGTLDDAESFWMDRIDGMTSWRHATLTVLLEKLSTSHQNGVLYLNIAPIVLKIFVHLCYILESIHKFFQVMKHVQTHTGGIQSWWEYVVRV
jgi:hypothetical protein